jgi:GNAT superfamily N-acetyltransferase
MTLPVYLTFTVLHHADLPPSDCSALIRLLERAFEKDCSAFPASHQQSVHVLMHERGELVSHACWDERFLQQEMHDPLRIAWVDAIATDPDHRHLGYGSAVMQVLEEHLWAYDLACLSTGLHDFCTQLGWEPWSGPLQRSLADLVTGSDELTVYFRRTLRTPDWLDSTGPLAVETGSTVQVV